MKINFRYSTFLLPLFLIGMLSFSFTENEPGSSDFGIDVLILIDTVPPSKAELKQERAQKKIEQEIKRAKYKEAQEKAKLYTSQSKSLNSSSSSPKKELNKEKKGEKENKTLLSTPVSKGEVTISKPPKKEKNTAGKANANANKQNSKVANKSTKANKTKTQPTPVKVSPGGIATKPGKKNKESKKDSGQSGKKNFVNAPVSTNVKVDDPKNRRRGKSCEFSYNVVDPITGQSKSALESRYFFGFTEKELMQFMKGEDYLSCNGYLSQVTGVKTLNLSFVIDSPYARDEYGSIQAGTQMIIRLVNGETITLISEKYDSGSVSRRTGKTTYKTLFIISAKDEKLLSKSEVDIVRMVWGAGYEDYEVYELDFFIDQLTCLNEAD